MEEKGRLIEELKKRLAWYQEEASEEECDSEEIEAIVNLLDRLEGTPDREYFTAEKAYSRFEKWYLPEVTERPEAGEEKTEKEKAKEEKNREGKAGEGKTGEEKPEREKTEKEKISRKMPETKKKEAGQKARIKKVLHYMAATAAAVLMLFTALNIGTYATAKKSFFELISQSTMGRSFFVTGEGAEDSGSMGEDMGFVAAEEKQYASWEELPAYLSEQICIPAYIPEGMELARISCWKDNMADLVLAVYKDGEISGSQVEIWVERYEDESAWQEVVSKEAEFVEQKTVGNRECFFYRYEEENMICFWEKNELYTVSGEGMMEELVKIVKNMQYIDNK